MSSGRIMEKNLSFDNKIINSYFSGLSVSKILLTHSLYCRDDWRMTEKRTESMAMSKQRYAPFPLYDPHAVLCHDHVIRGFGFALIDPVAMANAFDVGAAVLQFAHEASVMYTDAVFEAELRQLKYRGSQNKMNPKVFVGGSKKSRGRKRG